MTYLVDTSVLTRLSQAPVIARITEVGTRNCHVAVVSILEIGFTARNHDEHRRLIDSLRSTFTVVPASPWAQEHTIHIQRYLAAGGEHRSARVADLMIAATAIQLDATVLHYDRDFDTVSRVTGQPAEWVAAPGTLDGQDE